MTPSGPRRRLGRNKNARIQLTDNGKQIKPMTPQYVRQLRGILKGGRGLQALIEDRQMEKGHLESQDSSGLTQRPVADATQGFDNVDHV